MPRLPGKRYLDWDLADPAGQGVEAVRPIREEIAPATARGRRGETADKDGMALQGRRPG